MTEDEIVGWHHWLNGQGFGWTLGVCGGQGGLACCSSWSCKDSDMTERLNWERMFPCRYKGNSSKHSHTEAHVLIHIHRALISTTHWLFLSLARYGLRSFIYSLNVRKLLFQNKRHIWKGYTGKQEKCHCWMRYSKMDQRYWRKREFPCDVGM